jgi:hypothetical protein
MTYVEPSAALTLDAIAAALFCSPLQPSDHPGTGRIRDVLQDVTSREGGVTACIADMALCYGDHPEESAARVRWCRSLVVGSHWPPKA